MAIGRSQDPYQLSEKVIPHLEVIFKVPVTAEKSEWSRVVISYYEIDVTASLTGLDKIEWETFATIMEALLATLHGFTTFMQVSMLTADASKTICSAGLSSVLISYCCLVRVDPKWSFQDGYVSPSEQA